MILFFFFFFFFLAKKRREREELSIGVVRDREKRGTVSITVISPPAAAQPLARHRQPKKIARKISVQKDILSLFGQ